jgi:hypothetical protein
MGRLPRWAHFLAADASPRPLGTGPDPGDGPIHALGARHNRSASPFADADSEKIPRNPGHQCVARSLSKGPRSEMSPPSEKNPLGGGAQSVSKSQPSLRAKSRWPHFSPPGCQIMHPSASSRNGPRRDLGSPSDAGAKRWGASWGAHDPRCRAANVSSLW